MPLIWLESIASGKDLGRFASIQSVHYFLYDAIEGFYRRNNKQTDFRLAEDPTPLMSLLNERSNGCEEVELSDYNYLMSLNEWHPQGRGNLPFEELVFGLSLGREYIVEGKHIISYLTDEDKSFASLTITKNVLGMVSGQYL